jgi:hypothetical protein
VVMKKQGILGFFNWFKAQAWESEEDKEKILQAGKTAIKFAMKASWWDWVGGSRIFFWRWPPKYFEEACFGLPPQFVADPPTSKDRQRPYTNPKTEELEKRKMKMVIDCGYIKRVSANAIMSLMYFFSMLKGEVDIRMVYDGSKTGWPECCVIGPLVGIIYHVQNGPYGTSTWIRVCRQ